MSSSYRSLDWVLSHWAYFAVHRFISVYLCVFCVFLFHTASLLYYCEQWRIQNFCEGDAAGVWGQSPQRGPGAEALVGCSGGKAPRKAEHFL